MRVGDGRGSVVGLSGAAQSAAARPAQSPGSLPCRRLCARGWTFLSLLTGYFPPSTLLMPYVTKFLQHSARSQGAGGRGFQAGVSAAWGGVWGCS